MTDIPQPDYSDCARSVRESAALLDRMARGNIVKREELLHIVSYLQTTATSLEHHPDIVLVGDYGVEAEPSADKAMAEADADHTILDQLVTWKSLPAEADVA